MNEFLNESKDFGAQQTQSTFYQRSQFINKNAKKCSTRFSEFSQNISFREQKFQPSENTLKQRITSSLTKSSIKQQHPRELSTLEKVKNLSISLKFQNKFNFFQKSTRNPQKKPSLWNEELLVHVLTKKDKILTRLFDQEEFSLREFSWYLSNLLPLNFYKVAEVISIFEEVDQVSNQNLRSKIITKNDIISALIPEDHDLRVCLLAKNRSSGSFSKTINPLTKLLIAKALKETYCNTIA